MKNLTEKKGEKGPSPVQMTKSGASMVPSFSAISDISARRAANLVTQELACRHFKSRKLVSVMRNMSQSRITSLIRKYQFFITQISLSKMHFLPKGRQQVVRKGLF